MNPASDHDFPAYMLPASKVCKPDLRFSQIPRVGLEGRIRDALLSKTLVLVSAPAGYGKTTALRRGAEGWFAEDRVFWISADEDDDVQRIVAAIMLAVDPVDIPWRQSRLALGQIAATGDAGARQVAETMVDAIEAADIGHGLIVIDDLHRISDPKVFVLLDRLIERLPKKWVVAILTRLDPPWGWRGCGWPDR